MGIRSAAVTCATRRTPAEPVPAEHGGHRAEIRIPHLDDRAQFLGKQAPSCCSAGIGSSWTSRPARPAKAISHRVTNRPPSLRS